MTAIFTRDPVQSSLLPLSFFCPFSREFVADHKIIWIPMHVLSIFHWHIVSVVGALPLWHEYLF